MKVTIRRVMYPILAVLLVLGFIFVFTQNNYKKQMRSEDISRSIATPTPTPIKPSEKAMKIASLAYTRMSADQMKEFKKNYGNENMSDADFIYRWALGMDENPTVMAKNEAILEKTMAQENQPVYYNTGYDDSALNNIKNKQEELDRKQEDEARKQQEKLEKLEKQQQELEYEQRNMNNCIQFGFDCY